MSSNTTAIQLSQANQAYINSLSKKQTQNVPIKAQNTEDSFVSSNKKPNKFLKIGAIGAGLAFLGLATLGLVKKGKIPGISEIFSNTLNKNSFNHEKVFNEPINFDKYYKQTLDSLKDIKLKLNFDESKATDLDIETALKKIGVWDFEIEKYKDAVKNDPSQMHLLNLLSGFDNMRMPYRTYENILKIDSNIPKDSIDNCFRYITKIFPNDPFVLYSVDLEKCIKNQKEILGLDSLLEDAQIKTWGQVDNIFKRHITDIEFDKNSDSLKSLDEFLKFMATLKKGTLQNGFCTDLYSKSGLLGIDDFKKARKFYEALNDDALEKLSFNEITQLLSTKDKNSVQIVEILNNIPKEVLNKLSKYDIPTYVDFSEFYGIDSINQLNMAQKRTLLRKLVSRNASTFSSGKNIAKILPSNKDEYCSLMDKLAKSIGVNTTKLTPDEIQSFNKAIKEISKTIQGVDLNNATFKLDFSRKDFIDEAEKVLKNLSDKEKMEVMDYFGFELKEGKLVGYPINVNNGEKLSEITSLKAKKAVQELKGAVEKFASKNNKVTVVGASEEFNKSVNKILDAFPELRTIIQKQQHKTHTFTLDIHTFKVLQEVCSNPKFKQLSDDDKKVLEISSLLHDITKFEGERDVTHPIESAFDSYYIIQKLNLPENQQLKIYELIKTHNWLQQLNDPSHENIIESVAQDIAFDTRHTNTFEMAKILCEADLKSVKRTESFFNAHKKNLDEMSAKVDGYVKSLHDSQIILPQTVIPRASKVKNGVIKSSDGIQNTVIYMNQADNDLSKYGFSLGTTKENWTALVHALETPEQMSKFDTFNIIDTEALLSTSFINPDEYKVFRKQGLILDVNSNDIHVGYETDFGSGYTKTLDLLKEDYLFDYKRPKTDIPELRRYRANRTKYRNFISKKIQEKLGINPEQYYERLEKLQDCKSITDIEQVDKEFADSLLDVFKNMHAHKRCGGRKYNEMLITRPKIQGVFAYDKPYEKIPEFLRKYASDNDLPIIIFGQK